MLKEIRVNTIKNKKNFPNWTYNLWYFLLVYSDFIISLFLSENGYLKVPG